MKLVLSIEILGAVLAMTRRLKPFKNGIPELGRGLLVHNGILSATDLDVHLAYRIAPDAPAHKAFGLDRIELKEIVDLADAKSDVVLNGDGTINFMLGGSSATRKVKTYAPKDFPALPQAPEVTWTNPQFIDSEGTGDFRRAYGVASTDENRFVLCSVCLDQDEGGSARFVGTDGRRLFCSDRYYFNELKHQLIIPAADVFKMNAVYTHPWELSYALHTVGKGKRAETIVRYVRIKTGPWEFILRAIEANYPHWKQVVPKSDCAVRAEIPAKRAAELARTLTKLRGKVHVRCNGTLEFEHREDKEGATPLAIAVPDTVITKREGVEMVEAAFDPLFIAGALAGGANVIELESGSHPVLARTPTNGRYVLMPMRAA